MKTKHKINNIWLYIMIIMIFSLVTMIIVSSTVANFRAVWTFWSWYLFLAVFIGILVFVIIMFIRHMKKVKLDNKIEDKQSFK